MNISRILIGIDDSKYADHAAQYGFDLARKLNAAIGLVSIVEPIPASVTPISDTGFGMPFEGAADVNTMDLIESQNQAADSLLGRIVTKYGSGLQVTQYTDYGSSADGIINCAATFLADLIIIGTHKRSGFDRLLMGSVAEEIVRNATIPVLVVPLNEEE